MTEYLPVKVGDVIDRDGLTNLRTGTIVKARNDAFPTFVADEDFRYDGTAQGLFDLPDEDYIVLYVPAPPAPQVGERLTLEQLDALPRWSVVQMADPTDHSTFQLIREANSSVYEVWSGWGFEADSHALWQHVRGNLTLFWLPETAKD
jgi:hypothetical protein